MLFNRDVQGRSSAEKVIGVGHKVFEKAIRDASELPVSMAYISDLSRTLVAFHIFDRVTDQMGHMSQSVVGIELWQEEGQQNSEIIRDWEVLMNLNKCKLNEKPPEQHAFETDTINSILEDAEELLKAKIEKLGLPFRISEYRPVAILLGIL